MDAPQPPAVKPEDVALGMVEKLLGWLTSTGIGDTVAKWFGLMIEPVIGPIIEKYVKRALENSAEIGKPNADLQDDWNRPGPPADA